MSTNTKTNVPSVRRRLLALLAVFGLLLAACGGSSDDSGSADPPTGDSDQAASPPADEGEGSSGGDLDIELDLGDEELNELLEETIEDIDESNDPDPDSPYAGIRIWETGVRVEELLPGAPPHNLAPNPLDEFSLEGLQIELTDFAQGQNMDRYQRKIVADTNWAWVVEDEVRVSLADYATGEVAVSVEASALDPEGAIVAIAGDENGIYVAVDNPAGDDAVVELDAATGEERGRTLIADVPSPLLTLDANDGFVAVGRRDGIGAIDVIDRSTREIAFSVAPTDDFRVPLLTTDELLVVETGNETFDRHALPSGDVTESGIALPGDGVTRAFGDTVIQYAEETATELDVWGVMGEGEMIASALPDSVFHIGDVHFDDGFVVVAACCGERDGIGNADTLFVIDQASGEVVLTSNTSAFNVDITPAES